MWENFFRVEGPVFKIGSKAWSLLVLNVLIILTSLPIVTIGSAMTASYYVTVKMIQDEDYQVVKNYMKSFKESIKQSTLIWLCLLLVIMVLAVDWFYLVETNQLMSWMSIGVGIITLFVSQVYQVSFFYLSRYEIGLKQMIKNTIQMMFQQPIKSILLLIIFLLPVGLMLLSPYFFVFNMYISLFIGISFNLFLRTYVLLMMFRRYDVA